MYREPFGTESRASATDSSTNQHQASSSSGQGSSRYAGEQREAVSGLYYNRARYYDPKTGRFTQEDTYAGQASDQNSVNRFAYAHNSPTNLTDPDGNCPVCLIAAVALGGFASYTGQVINNLQNKSYTFGDALTKNLDFFDITTGALTGWFGYGAGRILVPAAYKLVGTLAGSVVAGRATQVFDNFVRGKELTDDLGDPFSIGLDLITGGAGYRLGQIGRRQAIQRANQALPADNAIRGEPLQTRQHTYTPGPGDGPGTTNAQRGAFGERVMHEFVDSQGWSRIIGLNESTGIDGIYNRKVIGYKKFGFIDRYLVAEAKFNTSTYGTVSNGTIEQMSVEWIEGPVGNTNRLRRAVGGDIRKAAKIRRIGYERWGITHVSYPDGAGRVTFDQEIFPSVPPER